MTVILGQMFTGISIGAVLLLIALGLSLTFGQMNVINMAHGEFIMAGAYTTYVLQKSISSAGISLLVALPVAFLVSGALGALLEWLLIRRLYLRPLDTLLVTWGVSLMLQQLARDIFGAPNVQTRAPDVLTGNITVIGGDDPLTFANSRLFILGLALAAVVALALTLRLTRSAAGSVPSCRTGTWPRCPASPPDASTAPRSSSDPGSPEWPGWR